MEAAAPRLAPVSRYSLARLWAGEPGYLQAAVAVGGAVATGWAVGLVRGGALVPPAWPLNAVLLGGFVAWLWLLSRCGGRWVAWLGGVPFALAAMLAVGLLGAVGGVVPQHPAEAPGWAKGLGFDRVFGGAPFAVALLLLLANLGLATFRKGRLLGARGWLFSLNHAGIWIALASAMFGAGDVIRARMQIAEGAAEAMIVDGSGRHGYLPFGLLLQRFYIEHYGEESGRPGAPKRFTAEVGILRPGRPSENGVITVNRPLRRDGWTLYLTSYELSPGGGSDQCLIEAVRDPWLPGVYTGIFLMLGGAVAMLFKSPFERGAA
jgi:hypothetical protein